MMRIGYRHADRLISYPHAHNLSVSQLPIRVGGRFRRPGGQARMERPGRSAAECFGAWLRHRRRRQNSPCTSRAVPLPVQNSPCSLEMPRFGAFCVCRANFVPLWPTTSQAGRTMYRIRGGHEASRHNHTPSATGVEDAGGTRGHGLGAGGWRQDQGGYISDTVSQAPPVFRAPEGPEGTGGLRDAAPNE